MSLLVRIHREAAFESFGTGRPRDSTAMFSPRAKFHFKAANESNCIYALIGAHTVPSPLAQYVTSSTE